MESDKRYKVQRYCLCGNVDEWMHNKKEAAFELFDIQPIYDAVCTKCGKVTFRVLTQERPSIDDELMEEWAVNETYHFSSQDEDLVLADKNNLPFILKVLNNAEVITHKKTVLLATLCVMVYDLDSELKKSLSSEKKMIMEKEMSEVLDELEKRKKMLTESEEYIMEYIKEVVFPKLKLAYRSSDI